ncbi:hypothetical protein GCM10023201_22770 [Actinomycetospora corticicola]
MQVGGPFGRPGVALAVTPIDNGYHHDMAVPKRRMSRANTHARRSQWKAQAPDLVPITVDGREIRVPRPLVRAYQRGILRPDD